MEKRSIVLSDIEKSFGKKKALNGINADFHNSEIVGLLGPNGSGKSTLFYIIAGLINPDKGDIFLDNLSIKEYPMYRRARLGIGYLPQDVSIFRGMTAEENIAAVLEIYYKDKKIRKAKLNEIIEKFSIGHIRKSNALALSGGERRRVEIARTIAANPSFVLFDEPFAGVDPIAVGELRNLIKSLKMQNIGVLITDHNVMETLNIVDRAYILYNGKLIFQGDREEIINNDDVKRVYLGDTV